MPSSDLARASLVAVYGHGRAGRSLVRHLRAHAPRADLLVLLDAEPDEDTRDAARDTGFDLVVGAAAIEQALSVLPVDLVARSPGVSPYHGPLTMARARGIPVTTATNLWFEQYRPTNVVGVTGTKGKSTTASLVAHLLSAAGRRVALAGNIGTPLLDLEQPPSDVDVVVVELSSYQLADFTGHLRIGVLLNLHRDHVTWHGSEAQYVHDKMRIGEGSDVLIANAEHLGVAEYAARHGDVRWFAASEDPIRLGHSTIPAIDVVAALERSPLVGAHNLANAAAALTVVATLAVDPRTVVDRISDFEALHHRLEVVHDDGRRWVDDSIATIPEAAVAALRAFPRGRVTLIAGGHDRGQDHASLVDEVLRRGDVAVVTLPATGARLARELRTAGAADVMVADDLTEAVAAAAAMTPAGGVVLLSPAAASFGQFTSFEERGSAFARLAAAAPGPA